MKRRIFITSTGLIGAFASTGLANTSSILTPSSPWHFNEELDEMLVESLDVFADLIKGNLQDPLNYNKLLAKLVNPKKVILQDRENGIFIFENYASNKVCISNKNGETQVKILKL